MSGEVFKLVCVSCKREVQISAETVVHGKAACPRPNCGAVLTIDWWAFHREYAAAAGGER